MGSCGRAPAIFAMFFSTAMRERQMSIKGGPEDERPREKLLRAGRQRSPMPNCWPSSCAPGQRPERGGSLPPAAQPVWLPAALLGAEQQAFCRPMGWGRPSMPSCRRCWRWAASSGRAAATGEALTSPQLTRDYSAGPVAGSRAGGLCAVAARQPSTEGIPVRQLFTAPWTRRASGPGKSCRSRSNIMQPP